MGNICRSPTAEIIWKTKLQSQNLSNGSLPKFDSAGTISYHQGDPPDSRMQIALKEAGYTPFGFSRQITEDDFDQFDLILAMDKENLRSIRSLARSSGKPCDHCHLFLDYVVINGGYEVPDPYYGGNSGFKDVVTLIDDACQRLLIKLQKEPS